MTGQPDALRAAIILAVERATNDDLGYSTDLAIADAVIFEVRAHLVAVLADEATVEAVMDALADYTPWGNVAKPAEAVLTALLPILTGGTK